MNHIILLLGVIVAFSAIHFVEMTSFNARSAGVRTTKIALGYVIQNTTFTFTRFFYICLLPVLGYLSDIKVEPIQFVIAIHVALLSAFLVSAIVYWKRHKLVDYYCGVIQRYAECGKLTQAFLLPDKNITATKQTEYQQSPLDKGIVIRAAIVYMIYAVGVFSVFLLAVKNPDHRGVLSQLSGLINGFATLLLTLKIEPAIARFAEDSPSDFDASLRAMMLGRLLGVGVFAQLFFFCWNGIF